MPHRHAHAGRERPERDADDRASPTISSVMRGNGPEQPAGRLGIRVQSEIVRKTDESIDPASDIRTSLPPMIASDIAMLASVVRLARLSRARLRRLTCLTARGLDDVVTQSGSMSADAHTREIAMSEAIIGAGKCGCPTPDRCFRQSSAPFRSVREFRGDRRVAPGHSSMTLEIVGLGAIVGVALGALAIRHAACDVWLPRPLYVVVAGACDPDHWRNFRPMGDAGRIGAPVAEVSVLVRICRRLTRR